MKRVLLLAVLFAACSGEPGGGGVNIEETSSTSTSAPPTSTTSTTIPTTTTTTLPLVEVSGTVRRPSGSVVAGATVTMGASSTVTGPDGTFFLETATPGNMTVSKRGWSTGEIVWDETTPTFEAVVEMLPVRGLRVSAEAAADDAHYTSLLTLAADTAVNALVFDTKQEGGKVLYATSVDAANSSGAVEPWYDPASRISEAHETGLYTITRIVTFEDSFRVSAFPDDKLAGAWVDPAATAAREYNLALAAEACEIGFDEIQFDYVRYPAGQTAEISGQRDMTQEERVANISSFLADARAILEPMGCAVSAAMFGIVTSMPDDQGLGQRPEELSAHLDAVSPMVYPSHYSPGWLGFEDPNAFPYEVTADSISDTLPVSPKARSCDHGSRPFGGPTNRYDSRSRLPKTSVRAGSSGTSVPTTTQRHSQLTKKSPPRTVTHSCRCAHREPPCGRRPPSCRRVGPGSPVRP